MNEIQRLAVNTIDPESEVNVRKIGVNANVENVKIAIEQNGYHPEHPIVVRPHPNPTSSFEYECVVGQCRLRACHELGLKEIPAIVERLNDEDAIRRSWTENERRGDLSFTDKAYWVDRIYKNYEGKGYTSTEAHQLAAKFLGVTVQTVLHYHALIFLPPEVKDIVDRKLLPQKYGIAIAKTTYVPNDAQGSQQRMKERADWFLGLDKDLREIALKALDEKSPKANISDLNLRVEAERKEIMLKVTVPKDLVDSLFEWGKERGLYDQETILSHMIHNTISPRRK